MVMTVKVSMTVTAEIFYEGQPLSQFIQARRGQNERSPEDSGHCNANKDVEGGDADHIIILNLGLACMALRDSLVLGGSTAKTGPLSNERA
jgi:hypothetical protein